MKKYILTAICALACTFAFGAKNTFTVISGSTDALKSAATYTTVFNYENVTIADMSLADFLASKDDKFREDWKNVIVPGSEAAGSNVMVIATDEKWMPETDGTADYTVTFNFKRMDLGYVAVFGGTKTGGAQFEGTLAITDNATGETVCEIEFFVAGSTAFSDKDRLAVAYAFMGRDMKKFLKKN